MPAIHPLANLLPPMAPDEYQTLVTSIRERGLRDPITLADGLIVDGRHRYQACAETGTPPRFQEWDGVGSLVLYIVDRNIERRHLSSAQRATIALDIERALANEAKDRQRENGQKTGRANKREPSATAAAQSTQTTTFGDAAPTDASSPMNSQKVDHSSAKKNAAKSAEQAAKAAKTNRQYVSNAKALEAAAPDLLAQVRAGTLGMEAAMTELRKRRAAAEQAKPKPLVVRALLPVILEVADARRMPLDDAVVDLIVTSPPYGLDIAYEGGDVAAGDWQPFMVEWLEEAYRVTKSCGRLALNIPLDTTLGGARPCYAQAISAALAVGWRYKATIVWHEGNTTKGNRALGSVNSAARPHPVAPVEMIPLFYRDEWGPSSDGVDDIAAHEWQECGRGVWTFGGQSSAWEGHPAAFPEELPRRLIRYLSRVGDIVLDPFVGSGTTVLMAYRNHRQGIGYDISEAYVESAARRVQAAALEVAS